MLVLSAAYELVVFGLRQQFLEHPRCIVMLKLTNCASVILLQKIDERLLYIPTASAQARDFTGCVSVCVVLREYTVKNRCGDMSSD